MRVTMLFENEAAVPGLFAGHGLSLHVAAGGQSILFDVGRDAQYAANAERLGVDIAGVSFLALSHAHNDHGGGLGHFLTHNATAPVYVGPRAFEGYYYDEPHGPDYIGLDAALAGNPRFVVNPGYAHPGEGVELFCLPQNTPRVLQGSYGHRLWKRDGSGYTQDDFTHEQSMVVNEGGRRLLVSGCSHSGIVNILDEAEKLCGAPMDVVMGGFHLSDPHTGAPEAEALLLAVAESLAKRPTRYYAFHCTGAAAIATMKTVLGERLATLHGGDGFEL